MTRSTVIDTFLSLTCFMLSFRVTVYSVSEDNPRIFSSVSGILNKQNLVLPKVNYVNRGIEISKTERYFHR